MLPPGPFPPMPFPSVILLCSPLPSYIWSPAPTSLSLGVQLNSIRRANTQGKCSSAGLPDSLPQCSGISLPKSCIGCHHCTKGSGQCQVLCLFAASPYLDGQLKTVLMMTVSVKYTFPRHNLDIFSFHSYRLEICHVMLGCAFFFFLNHKCVSEEKNWHTPPSNITINSMCMVKGNCIP